jgi:hypothetical protein
MDLKSATEGERAYSITYDHMDSAILAHMQCTGGVKFKAVHPNELRKKELLNSFGGDDWSKTLQAGSKLGSKSAVKESLESLGLPSAPTTLLQEDETKGYLRRIYEQFPYILSKPGAEKVQLDKVKVPRHNPMG